MQTGGLRTRGMTKTSSDSHPLITVVTVVFNAVETVEQTILSVINQTYDNVEYIVVDGASTDGTLDVIKKYEDKIDCWISEPDKGIYDAMNKGIGLASGEWINFMNAGDLFYDVEIIKEVFEGKQYDASVIYGNTMIIFNYGTVLYTPKVPSLSNTSMPFNHQSVFTLIDEFSNRKYNTRFKICADFDFYYNMLKERKKFTYVNQIIAQYEGRYGVSAENRYSALNENFIISITPLKYFKYVEMLLRNIIVSFVSGTFFERMLNKYRLIKYNKRLCQCKFFFKDMT